MVCMAHAPTGSLRCRRSLAVVSDCDQEKVKRLWISNPMGCSHAFAPCHGIDPPARDMGARRRMPQRRLTG